MELVLSPCGIVDKKRPGQGLMDIGKAGFEKLVCDLSMLFETRKPQHAWPLEYWKPERLYECFRPVLEKGKEIGLSFPVAEMPGPDTDTGGADLNGFLMTLAQEGVKVCGKIGCHNFIVSPLFVGIPRDDLWNENREFFLRIAGEAREKDITVLLKNQCRNFNGHLVRGVWCDGQEASAWVDRLNEEVGEERFGFCMDVGICNLCGQNMYDFITALGHRLRAVVLRDNDGSHDNALLPFTAVNGGALQTDWLNLIRGLRDICFDGHLILNITDTASVASPILKPGLLQYAKSVLDYFCWQIRMESMLKKYPSRVLFGAGNMCRNYMKCYGDGYPPLYTCDNDERLWNTEFCGLTVKAPEALRQLEPDTVILICNTFYREIEQQLRKMDLQNPIEYFNDEYMSSFYFDRLEREG